ncbi:PrgI family protein [archaeon]
MAYEIPQALKYEEKVLFGLTLEQFAYMAIALLLAGVIYFRVDGIPMAAKTGAIAMIAIGGMGFAFFDFKKHAKNLVTFYNSPRSEGYLDAKTKNFVEVRDVNHDMVYMKDGTAKAIVQVMPINFGIKSETEQEAIIENYQAFLNSLTFPVQILMRTVNLNLDDYMECLQDSVEATVAKKGNSDLLPLFKDYRSFMEKFIRENAIQDRLFYVVIPLKQTGKGKEAFLNLGKEMEVRTNLVKEKLNAIGLKTRRMTTNQLVSLLASFFEGYIEVENDYLFPMTMLDKYAEVKSYE